MKHKDSHGKSETTRLTIDFPKDQHIYLKMLAAEQGVSLRQFVIDHLPNLHGKEKKQKDMDRDKFGRLVKKFLVKKANLMKRLADK
jgi:hypothetical protein